jgi:hypothetical protein
LPRPDVVPLVAERTSCTPSAATDSARRRKAKAKNVTSAVVEDVIKIVSSPAALRQAEFISLFFLGCVLGSILGALLLCLVANPVDD